MQKFVNNWGSTLQLPATADDLELAVDTAGLPALESGDHYLLTLSQLEGGVETAWEIVRVTGVAEGVLTLSHRGVDGDAQAWPAASIVSCRLTAGTIAEMLAAGVVDDTGWLIAEPAAGRTGSYEIPVRRLNGVVHMRGLHWFDLSDSGEILATLPAGCRPDTMIDVVVVNANGRLFRVYVYDDGGIQVQQQGSSTGNDYLPLDTLSFIAA